jgi:hypothetical protein
MYENRFKDSDVLNKGRAALGVVSELALMLIYWALALLVYGAKETAFTLGQADLTFSDIRIALLFSAGFMVLSGYVFSVVFLYAFYSYRKSWTTRAVLNAGLFLVHFAIFGVLVGSSHLNVTDLPLAILGVVGVLAAVATTGLVVRTTK